MVGSHWSSPEIWEFYKVGGTTVVSLQLFTSPSTPPQGGQGALAHLQGPCSVFLDTTWAHFNPEQKEQAGSTGHHYTHFSTKNHSGSVSQCPRCLLPTCQNHAAHTAYLRPLLQDWDRQLFYLIHVNKHGMSNKIKGWKISLKWMKKKKTNPKEMETSNLPDKEFK